MKGQAALEFLVYVSIVALIMIIFLWNSISLQNQSIHTKIDSDAKKICDTVAYEINSAARSGDGYNRKFFIPKSFSGINNFTIEVVDYSVFIDWESKSVICNIITKNVTNTTSINKGFNFIENKNGNIYVTCL